MKNIVRESLYVWGMKCSVIVLLLYMSRNCELEYKSEFGYVQLNEG